MRWLRLFLVVLLVPLAACAVTPRAATYEVTTSGPYHLDSGDVLRVTVYGDTGLSTTYKVDDSGAISFPLVGAVKVRGQTTEQAGKRIAAALAHGYMRNPNVAVEVAQYRPFFIQGAVTTSGQFPYAYAMTVRDAISTAGGFKDTANESQVTVYRRIGNRMVKSSVGLDFPIQPGDTLVVGERWF